MRAAERSAPMTDRPQRAGGSLHLALAMLGLCGMAAASVGLLLRPGLSPPPLQALRAAPEAAPEAVPAAAPNELTYRADRSGHFLVDASVNGAPIRFLVDTGATMVVLSPEDARTAGLSPEALRFSAVLDTANGTAHAAPARLRSLRLGQLEVEDVPVLVMERPMAVSLLGMSFLSRLDGYSIRDGVLTLDW
jgi:aspartyl protease family protein